MTDTQTPVSLCASCGGSGQIDDDTACLACLDDRCGQHLYDDTGFCDLPANHSGPCAYTPRR